MKKSTAMIVFLLVIPLSVVAVASSPSGATVYDGETAQMITWFQTVEGSAYGWCLPVAALLNYIAFGLAVIFGLKKKQWSLQGIFWLSFAALCLASVPIVVQTEIKTVPNILGVLLLGAESLAAHLVRKNPELFSEKEKTKGKQLKQH